MAASTEQPATPENSPRSIPRSILKSAEAREAVRAKTVNNVTFTASTNEADVSDSNLFDVSAPSGISASLRSASNSLSSSGSSSRGSHSDSPTISLPQKTPGIPSLTRLNSGSFSRFFHGNPEPPTPTPAPLQDVSNSFDDSNRIERVKSPKDTSVASRKPSPQYPTAQNSSLPSPSPQVPPVSRSHSTSFGSRRSKNKLQNSPLLSRSKSCDEFGKFTPSPERSRKEVLPEASFIRSRGDSEPEQVSSPQPADASTATIFFHTPGNVSEPHRDYTPELSPTAPKITDPHPKHPPKSVTIPDVSSPEDSRAFQTPGANSNASQASVKLWPKNPSPPKDPSPSTQALSVHEEPSEPNSVSNAIQHGFATYAELIQNQSEAIEHAQYKHSLYQSLVESLKDDLEEERRSHTSNSNSMLTTEQEGVSMQTTSKEELFSKQEIERKIQDATEEYSKRISYLERAFEKEESLREELESKCRTLETELEEKAFKYSETLSTLREENEAAEEQLAEYQREEKNTVNTSSDSSKQELSQARETIEELKQAVAEFEKTQSSDRNQFQQRVFELERTLELQKQERDQQETLKRNELEEKQDDIDKLKQTVESLENQNTKSESIIRNLEETIHQERSSSKAGDDSVVEELEKAQNVIAELNRKIQQLEHDANDSTKLSDDVLKLQEELKEERKRSMERDMKIGRLRKTRDQLQEDNMGLNIALEAKQHEVQMLKRERRTSGAPTPQLTENNGTTPRAVEAKTPHPQTIKTPARMLSRPTPSFLRT